ncbi:MAG: hypothetical protein ACKVT2_22380 [Saprospiraceae bacterium]
MHNLDRIMNEESSGEYGYHRQDEQGAYGAAYEWEDQYETGEGEYEDDGEYENEYEYNGEYEEDREYEYDGEYEEDREYENEYDGEYEEDREYENEYDGEYEEDREYEYNEREARYERDSEFESPFSEEEEMELATELLNVNNEAELDQFLGGLISSIAGPLIGKATRWIGSKLKRKGRKLSRRAARRAHRALKKIRRVTSPMPSVALDTSPGGYQSGATSAPPGPPASIPSGYQSSNTTTPPSNFDDFQEGNVTNTPVGDAAELYGLELEGLSQEDQEFEIAKRFVNLVGETARQAAEFEQTMPPERAADTALKIAAGKYAPGLLAEATPPRRPAFLGRKPPGHWIRHGRNIVILNAY